ncbi:MAG TPA: hypothetical protein ENK57_23260 [Polyangiaceae bacterium]|nr:hypothetical protein [Polyangiaceae bacterium]
MNNLQDLQTLMRAHPTVSRWFALPTDQTSSSVLVAPGTMVGGARIASRRLYRPETGYAKAGPDVDLCICGEPLSVGVSDPSFLHLLERASRDRVSLVLVAPWFSDETQATLAVNNERGSLNAMALVVNASGLAEITALFQISASPLDQLRAHRLRLEVIATARAAAFLRPKDPPLGIVSVGGFCREAMWETWGSLLNTTEANNRDR